MTIRQPLILAALLACYSSACFSDDDPPFDSTASTPIPDATAEDYGEGLHDPVVQDPPHDEPDLPMIDHQSWQTGAWIVGRSVENRPLIVEQYGDEGPLLFLFAGIHGNERSAVTFGERIRSALLAGLAEYTGLRIIFMAAANPDGITNETRENARGIDVNRNFDTANFGLGSSAGGTTPLSEPESRILAEIIDATLPDVVLSIHCCVPILDYDGPALDLAEAMAAAMDEGVRFPVGRLGSMPGSAGSYIGVDLGIPIITVEFTQDQRINTFLQLENVERAVEAAAWWVVDNSGQREANCLSVFEEPRSPLKLLSTPESAGGLELRVEQLEIGEGPPIFVLSGLNDNDQRSLSVAEHLRRALLHESWNVPLFFFTAINPDGISSNTSLNATGIDVAEDFASGRLHTNEAQFLSLLLETERPALIVNVVTDPDVDSVSYWGISPEALEGAIPFQLADAGQPTDRVSSAIIARDIPLLVLGVNGEWGRGDDFGNDYFPNSDQAVYSALVRRIIKPGVLCASDGYCDPLCTIDPDCPCACDYYRGVCEAVERGSLEACPCDPDCLDDNTACSADGHCDTWCPPNTDPDCPCSCDYHLGICEAAARNSSETCLCDPDCEGGLTACSADGHCDTWCPEGVDPDC